MQTNTNNTAVLLDKKEENNTKANHLSLNFKIESAEFAFLSMSILFHFAAVQNELISSTSKTGIFLFKIIMITLSYFPIMFFVNRAKSNYEKINYSACLTYIVLMLFFIGPLMKLMFQ